MRPFVLVLIILVLACSGAFASGPSDYAGIVRVFGDVSSWTSSCFVVGDGSWVLTTYRAISERIGPDADQPVQYPLFISAYTGQVYQCELKAYDKEQCIALLKLPVSGLPAAPLAQLSDFSKAAYGTIGQLMSGEPVGNAWNSEIFGITRQRIEGKDKLVVGSWSAKKAFVTEIGDDKCLFIRDVAPETAIPSGSMVVRGSNIIGMYAKRMTIVGGKEDLKYGHCVMSTALARYLGNHGIDTSSLYTPPAPTVKRAEDADAVFQLQARIYAFIGAGKPALEMNDASELVKLRPKEAQTHLVMAVVYTGAGKFDEAIKELDAAASIDAKYPGIHLSRALALVGLKKKTEAEAELLKAVEEAPNDPRPVTALADYYLGDKATYDKALPYAKRASAMTPNSPASLLLVAKAQKEMKDYRSSILTIQSAVKMAPDWGTAWFAMGSTYEEAGDKENAEKAYRALLQKQPKNVDALLTLASYLADQGKKDDALATLDKLRVLTPPKEVLDAAKVIEDKANGVKPTEAESKK